MGIPRTSALARISHDDVIEGIGNCESSHRTLALCGAGVSPAVPQPRHREQDRRRDAGAAKSRMKVSFRRMAAIVRTLCATCWLGNYHRIARQCFLRGAVLLAVMALAFAAPAAARELKIQKFSA